MQGSIGFIGAGHLASFTIEGLRQSGYEGAIALSPRNEIVAKALAQKFGCAICSTNQAVVDASEIVVLSLRPEHAATVPGELSFRSNQLVISSSTGSLFHEFAQLVAPGRAVRAMLIASAALCEGPVSIYPDDSDARALLSRLGRVFAFTDERSFRLAAQAVVTFSWLLALNDELIKIEETAGLPAGTAGGLVSETMKAACIMASNAPGGSVARVVESIAKPKTYSRAGLDVLRERGAFDAWWRARQSVADRAARKTL